MEPQRVRELMRENFGAVWSDEHEWVNVHDGKQTKVEVLAAFIADHIDTEEVLVQIDYEHAAKVAASKLAGYIAPHVLTADIQIANLSFTQFLFVAASGVAAGWNSRQSRGQGGDA